MEKYNLEKIKITQQILEGLADKISKLTSGNVSHNIASIKSVTANINEVMIDNLIIECKKNDEELKQLLKEIKTNIQKINKMLITLTPSTVNNEKKHLSEWIKFYSDSLLKYC